MKKTWFISDLHLDTRRPQMIVAFLDFLDDIKPQAEALYILGDLFEYWIGDDVLLQKDHAFLPIIHKLKQLSDAKVKLYFIAGNRDFLIGEHFAMYTACQIIDEAKVIDLYGIPTLLMHGDTLCTDDKDYIKFRAMIRAKQWKNDFLNLSISQRIEQAQALRDASKQQTGQKIERILDVNQAAVTETMKHYNVLQLIHGHTHRMATHVFDIDGKSAKRFVLGDWYDAVHFLSVSSNSYTIV
jgi:UDP-2,3-diacylglucosamine hydrolase